MTIRRAISAVVTFAFVMLLCAPAFAGFWAEASADEAGCCCGMMKDKESEQPSAHGEQCACAGCGCTVEEQVPMAPYDGVFDAPATSLTVALAPSVELPALDATPLDGVRVPATARGPPQSTGPPLYILYDSFLI